MTRAPSTDTGEPAGGQSRTVPSGASFDEDYFRPRDFEYVQPLYDFAFLLEVEAHANQTPVPKYRTFSLWRAGYSLDGYGTTVDRRLDATGTNDDLDYAPTRRILEYLRQIRRTGTHAELRKYRSERFARCLRLRSVRGLGPVQIARVATKGFRPEDWFNSVSANDNTASARIRQLYEGSSNGPWQSAHVIPPLLRFLKAVERGLGEVADWSIVGITDPFEPVEGPVWAYCRTSRSALESAVGKALRREKFFRRGRRDSELGLPVKHQMGWAFEIVSQQEDAVEWRSIPQLAHRLDPFAVAGDGDLASDLHVHTAWSDGSASVNTMAGAVAARGFKFFAVTDHSRSSKLQGGLTPVLWLRQANALTLAAPVCPVLHGVEVDILRDGSLDLPHSLLAAADLVIGSVHSNWTDSKRENTRRLLKAVESGCIDILAHPTSAVLGKPGVPDYVRAPAEVDWDLVFERCAEWLVALELNCFPSRLDLPLPLLRRAIEAGCAISLGSDAHARSHLLNMSFGEAALRRLNPGVVLNRLSHAELTERIRESRAVRKTLRKATESDQQTELLFEAPTDPAPPLLTARIQPPQHIPLGSSVVGIDLTAGDKATGLAVLDGLVVETCSLTTDEEILEYVRQQAPAIVSIDSPLGLPGGGDTIDPKAGIMRMAEYDLASVGIPAYPALIDSMEKLTLRGIRLRRKIEAFPEAPRVIESYPGAAQDILCIPRKQGGLDLLREGLRRLGLKGPGLDTSSHDEMDAITAAIVGRYYESGLFELMGIPSEAQLIVPKVHPLSFENNPVICLAGKTGVGKSVVARYLSVFYGFHWVRTRDVIRDLLIDDIKAPKAERLYPRKIDPDQITETDLREFGAVVLNVHKQVPLRRHLKKYIRRITTPVVVDSIRDIRDVRAPALRERVLMTWFVDCSDAIIQSRLATKKKLGETRLKTASPVDHTASAIRDEADQIISNAGSLEALRWRVDDALFKNLRLLR